jgi:hypothetical protein
MLPVCVQVYGENGDRLFDFRAEGTLGFKLDKVNDVLLPSMPLPW